MKKLTASALAILSLLCLSRLSAQIPGAPPRWSFGVKGGINAAKVFGKDATGSSTTLRPVAGVFGVFRLYAADLEKSHDDMFDAALMPEVLRSDRGADWKLGSQKLALDSASKLRARYIEVPVLLRLNFAQRDLAWINLHFFGGPYFAFLRRCHVDVAGVPTGCADTSLHIRAFDWGAAWGGGVDVSQGALAFTLDLRWTSGHRLVAKKELTNQARTALVGIRVQPPIRAVAAQPKAVAP